MKTAIRRFFQKAGHFFSHLIPSDRAMHWASIPLFIVATILLVFSVLSMVRFLGWGEILIVLSVFLLLAALSAKLGDGLITWLSRLNSSFRLALILAASVFLSFFSTSMVFALVFLLTIVLVTSLIGTSSYYLWKDRNNETKTLKTFSRYALLAVGMTTLLVITIWFFYPGSEVETPQVASLVGEYRPPMMDAGNPNETGPYLYDSYTYGSGKDRHRPEFGQHTDIITLPVDGSLLLKGWKGMGGKLRTRYFGFDANELPLNARVWIPNGSGPFPLVLIVHGNHFGADYSDPGYEYLCEHWASRGFIAASVDQNFLNGMHTDILGSLGKENDARAWLLLEHLKQWTQWNADSSSPFFKRVDMQNMALVGHSRGGEAVGHAAMFNKLPFYPDDANLVFDYNFNLRAIIAIAPSDGQYKPSGVLSPVQDISYLAIQGSHDADVRSFDGSRFFERLRFSDHFEGFGALVYIYGANHGQFNSKWGRRDFSSPVIDLYNLKQLMPGEDQRATGMFFMTAFLEATMGFEPQYRKVFLDHRVAGDWLPETVYLTQYKCPGMDPVMDFSEDLDLTTATFPGAVIVSQALTDWYEKRIVMKFHGLESKGVYLGWDQKQNDTLVAEYTLRFNEPFAAGQMMYLTVADSGNEPSWRKNEENQQENQKENASDDVGTDEEESKDSDLIDFTIEIQDNNGERISFPLSSFSFLQPKLEARLAKINMLHPKPYGESILQLFYFSLEDHLQQNLRFDTSQIVNITLRFDLSPHGLIVVNDMGFTR